MTGDTPLLTMEGITKTFGGVPVLDDVSLALAAGEVHALLGENGAGKSTLMNVLAGIYAADAGEIRIGRAPVHIRRPADATAHGIGMVHQHFRLVAGFTASENLLLAASGRAGITSTKVAATQLREMGDRIGLAVRPDTPIRDLSIAERQRVEILKVLVVGARILILDEPTAVLTDQEAEGLLALVRTLAGQGLAIVLITHKLREVIAAGDRVSVMRKGRITLAGVAATGLDRAMLAQAMMGESPPPVARAARRPGAVRLAVRGLAVRRANGSRSVDGVSLSLRSGEIVGVAGVGGNGQQELADALVGLLPAEHGEIRLEGANVTGAGVWARRRLGLRYVPSDRSGLALVGDLSVTDNLALSGVRAGRYGRFGLARGAMRCAAQATIGEFAIAGATPGREARLLSGGNAQKLVLARELAAGVAVLVAHSPTRGLDVAACAFVHAMLGRAAAGGAAILLISEDLEEVLALSDRVLVMSRGRIAGERGADSSRAEIGALMLGHA